MDNTTWQGMLKLLRPKQWVKNIFVLAPLVFAGQFRDPAAVRQAALATALFCIAASAVYIVNDLHDVGRDRLHPLKCKSRPLAAGVVSPRAALLLLGGLYGLLFAGWWLAPAVVYVTVAYLLLNVAYTFVLKQQPVVDIFVIAVGFVLRVYAGAIALAAPLSNWMFITSLCLALYLAAIKRRQELLQTGTEGRAVLEKYSVALVNRYAEMSATGALVFYSLFVVTSRPEMVITIPLVLFGLFRYWYVVEVLEGGESPSDVLFADGQLLLTVVAWVGLCVWVLW
ncbi:MAG: decaprenyl-phosphate phosphoribosyltransferase [Candidatus Thiothrix singaporensis]|uniref:Decaprenyl-phosphate phosphoribosyltransferase n=1 Tax=Candidatus Thiothrix singaporensis TaxID=2799669 RepID=A0A7L6ANG7_9GAMM|nr:MAG: decaprenyl-phosphate phosphoribosyltransferase [Candidatus Thiothrix singaporensis]